MCLWQCLMPKLFRVVVVRFSTSKTMRCQEYSCHTARVGLAASSIFVPFMGEIQHCTSQVFAVFPDEAWTGFCFLLTVYGMGSVICSCLHKTHHHIVIIFWHCCYTRTWVAWAVRGRCGSRVSWKPGRHAHGTHITRDTLIYTGSLCRPFRDTVLGYQKNAL